MELFDKPYYRMSKVLLSFLGLWPLQSPCKRRLIRIALALFMSTIVIPEIIKLIEVLDNLDIVVECVPPLGLHVFNALKCITTSYHMDKLLKLMKRMDLDWKSREGGDGSKILNRYAEQARVLAIGYACYMFIGCLFYCSTPLLPLILDVIQPLNKPRPREFFFRTQYYIDQDEYFVLLYFHALTTTFMSMIILVACDTLYSAYVHYACAIFVELRRDLEKPFVNNIEQFKVSYDNDYVYRHIAKCVRTHKAAIEFCDLMESTYTVYFFCIIGINIFLISFTGVQTVMKLGDPSLVIRYSIYVFGQVMHAFFGCWHGQMLMDHSEEISIAVYKSAWYNWSFRTRQLVSLIIMRSQKPCRLSAGKIFFISLETFMTIIKTAMSYFTVIKSLQ